MQKDKKGMSNMSCFSLLVGTKVRSSAPHFLTAMRRVKSSVDRVVSAAAQANAAGTAESQTASERRSARSRPAVERAGMVDTSSSSFDSTLLRAANSSLQDLLDSTTPMELDDDDDAKPAADEQDDGEAEDDNAQHENKAKPAKGASKRKREPSTTRLQWKHGDSMQLLKAILTHVQSHGGFLPPVLRTTKGANCNPEWKAVGQAVNLMKDLDADTAGRRACTRWTNIKKELKVSNASTQSCASDALLTYSLLVLGQG